MGNISKQQDWFLCFWFHWKLAFSRSTENRSGTKTMFNTCFFIIIKIKNASSLVALIRGDFNQNEISGMPTYHITALLKILRKQVHTPYKVPMHLSCTSFLCPNTNIYPCSSLCRNTHACSPTLLIELLIQGYLPFSTATAFCQGLADRSALAYITWWPHNHLKSFSSNITSTMNLLLTFLCGQ